MKQLMVFLTLFLLFSFVSYGQTITTESQKEAFTQFSWVEASIDSAGADTSSTFGLNPYLTGSSTITNPFSYWYNITVAGTGTAAAGSDEDTIAMYIIFDGYHNTTWAALDTVTLKVTGATHKGVQLMNFNNWRSPDNKYRIRAAQIDGGAAVTAFKTGGIVIKP